MFLERSEGRFSATKIERIAHAFPVLAGLHNANVNSTFVVLGTGFPFGLAPRPTLVTDRSGITVYANQAWTKQAEGDPEISRALTAFGSDGRTEIELLGTKCCTWGSWEATFS